MVRMHIIAGVGMVLWLSVISARHPASAQVEMKDAAVSHLRSYPFALPFVYSQGITAFFQARDEYLRKDYRKAKATLDKLWSLHRIGSASWSVPNEEGLAILKGRSAFFGQPPCYSALRMLTDCVNWRVRLIDGQFPDPVSEPITWTVVLVGATTGKQPVSLRDLKVGNRTEVRNTLDKEFDGDGAQVLLEECTWLFREYVTAITDGKLKVNLKLVRMPEVELPSHVTEDPKMYAGPTDGAINRVWKGLSDSVKAKTDWYWVIHPSFVPDRFPNFKTTEFSTGHMAIGPDGKSPCFLIDDKWLIRKPGHIGQGKYRPIEREAYLPQWLQHEFFHHVFGLIPDAKLEEAGHDWLDRAKWPADFVGGTEADYFAETIKKRFKPDVLARSLKHAHKP